METQAPYTDKDLAGLVKELAIARRTLAQANEQIDDIEYKYKNRGDYKFAASTRASASEQIAALETIVREKAAELYAANQDKHPHPAVEVKIANGVEVKLDGQELVEWARYNFAAALTVDKAKITKAAREGLLPETVAVVTPIAKAFIASDLSSYEEE